MKTKTILTNLKCLECGNIQPIQRRKSLQKKIGHIKTMYCYKCKKRTQFYELKDLLKEN